MTVCRLDVLPVELVHQLFSHFSAHEILKTFSHVSFYLDDILFSYRSYQVNFQSISRTDLDLIYQRIIPDRVISLILSDDQKTPGLIEFFLNHFRINQFTHLQSLTLIDIGPDFWETIITQLVELTKLRSFVYFASDRRNEWVSNLSNEEIKQLDTRLSDGYAPILPQLYRLRLEHGDCLQSVGFPCLQHLTFQRVSADILKHICIRAPQLRSLRTSLSHTRSTAELMYPLPQLNRLVLEIRDLTVSKNDLERMLSNVPRLQHLELVADCSNDVIDGHHWEIKLKDLLTFKFMFYVPQQVEPKDLDSFRTSFWLDEKRWFVAYLNRCFYSVPYYNATQTNENFRFPLLSTAPNKNIFYEYINSLSLSEVFDDSNHYFSRVQTLTLLRPILLLSLKQLVDLSRVQHLILFLSMEKFPIICLLNEMPNLSKISIGWDTDGFLKQTHNERFENIHTLKINRVPNDTDVFINKKLSLVFPNVEHLHIDCTCSAKEIFHFLDQFKHLSNASFRYVQSVETEEDVQNDRLNIQSALDQARRLQKFNYTYRFDCSTVHLWI